MRFLILFSGLFAAAVASDILVDGNPPLTTGMVQNVTGILEWATGAALTPQQRAATQQLLVQSWRQHDQQQIAQWIQLSNLRAQLDALDPNQRETLRRSLAATLTPSSSSSGANTALTGKWDQRSGGSMVTYQNTVTGAFAAPTGKINRYVFSADGQYEYSELDQVSNYNCTTGYFGYEKGTYSVNGNQITFTQRQHSLEFKSTCSPSLNSNKTLPLETATYFYEIGQGQYGRELVITDGKTARWRFRRAD